MQMGHIELNPVRAGMVEDPEIKGGRVIKSC